MLSRKILLSHILRTILGFAFLFLAVGCDKFKTRPNSAEKLYYNHTITFSGETFGMIAAWYTGSSQNWMAIRDANPGIDPNRLRLGSVIKIPRALMQKDTPLTKAYIDSVRGKGKESKGGKNAIEQPVQPPDTIMPPSNDGPFPNSMPDVDPAIPPSEVPAAVVQGPPTIASPAVPPAIENGDDRTKTRDQLLKELLEDY